MIPQPGDVVLMRDGTLTTIKTAPVGKLIEHSGGFATPTAIVEVVYRPRETHRSCHHCGMPIRKTDSTNSLGQMWEHVYTRDGEHDVQWAPEAERPDPNPQASGHYAEPEDS